jgi:peptidoglycan/LPS O-acetylase OafA/YrhL
MAGGSSANSFDIARLVLASSVIFSHAPEMLDNGRGREPLSMLGAPYTLGDLAVIGFLILSGYLISMSWDRDPSPARFFRNRFLRIAPAFVVAFWFSVVVAGGISADDTASYYGGLPWRNLFFQMLTGFMPQVGGTFQGFHLGSANGALWTIRVEAMCYLTAPLVLARNSILLGSWVIAGWLATLTASAISGWTLMLPRLAFAFLTGALCWRFGLKLSKFRLVVSIFVLVLTFWVPNTWPAIATVAFAIPLMTFARSPAPAQLSADVSYGVYLYGWPIAMLLMAAGVRWPPLLAILALVGSLGAGLASWHLIEKHALALKGSASRSPTAPGKSDLGIAQAVGSGTNSGTSD